ncbi:hypothetical protein ACOMHN_052508 [Nucella lapillus]
MSVGPSASASVCGLVRLLRALTFRRSWTALGASRETPSSVTEECKILFKPVGHCETESGTVLKPVGHCETESGTVLKPVGHCETENMILLKPMGHGETENGTVLKSVGHCETENGTVLKSVRHCETENGTMLKPVGHCETDNGTVLNSDSCKPRNVQAESRRAEFFPGFPQVSVAKDGRALPKFALSSVYPVDKVTHRQFYISHSRALQEFTLLSHPVDKVRHCHRTDRHSHSYDRALPQSTLPHSHPVDKVRHGSHTQFHNHQGRALPQSALPHSHPAADKIRHSPSRQFHSGSGLVHSHFTHTAQHQGARARSRKRLPLSQSEEIEEVVSEHADVIQEFAAVLRCGEVAVRDMVRRDTRLLTQFDKEAVKAKMRLLLHHGFTPAKILSRYQVFCTTCCAGVMTGLLLCFRYQVFCRSYYTLQSRLAAMAPTKHYRHGLVTLLLSNPDFTARMTTHRREVAVMGDHSSQASYVADLLHCTEDHFRTLAAEHNFLLTLPPSRLREVVGVIRSFGLSMEEIRGKCLMLRCPPDMARDRLQRAVEAGVFDRALVSYALTNSQAHFEASFATWVRNAAALGGHANERELLMEKLQCSEADVRSLMRRKLSVSHLKSAKIKLCLEILQNEVGLSSKTILRQGNLLYYSPRRLRARWALLRSLDLPEAARTRELMLSERKFVAKYGYGSD